MVNSKKFSKSTIGLIVLALLLVLSTVLSLTNAWFTDSKSSDSAVEKDFGTVTMAVTATDFGKVIRTSNDASNDMQGKVMPGDKISYNLSVAKATGSEDFWFIVVLSGSITPAGGEAESLSTDLQALAEEDIKESAAEAVLVEDSLTLDPAIYGNDYKNADVSLSYTVYALQKANVSKAEALTIFKTYDLSTGLPQA